jgi:hypothetical protein
MGILASRLRSEANAPIAKPDFAELWTHIECHGFRPYADDADLH